MNNKLDYKEILFKNTALSDITNLKLDKNKRNQIQKEIESLVELLNILKSTSKGLNVGNGKYFTFKDAFCSQEVKYAIEKMYNEKDNDIIKNHMNAVVNELTINKNILTSKINNLLSKQKQLIEKIKEDKNDVSILKDFYFNFVECGNVHTLVLLTKDFFLNNDIEHYYEMHKELSEVLMFKAEDILDMVAGIERKDFIIKDKSILEKELYSEQCKRSGILKLNRKQIRTIFKELINLNECLMNYKEKIENSPTEESSLVQAFESTQTKIAFKEYFKESESKMKHSRNKDYEFLISNYIYCELKNSENNPKCIYEKVVSVRKEIQQLLQQLKCYKPNMNIVEKLFYLSMHIQDIHLLLSLTQGYFNEIKMSNYYEVISKLSITLTFKILTIANMYTNWEIEGGVTSGE